VEHSLRRNLPIITTPHAKEHLAGKGEGEAFSQVTDLEFFESAIVDIEKGRAEEDAGKRPAMKVTGMPGKHVPPGLLSQANDLLGAVRVLKILSSTRTIDCQSLSM
jgi:hypothetical protein